MKDTMLIHQKNQTGNIKIDYLKQQVHRVHLRISLIISGLYIDISEQSI
jgi:hypothetical protein